MTLRFYTDYRLGGYPKHYFSHEEDFMQIPDDIRKCVVFLKYRDSNQNEQFAGTGFFIGTKQENSVFVYLVTAKHVVAGIESKSKDGKVLIKMNNKNGGSQLIESNVHDWVDNPEDTSVDIKVLACMPSPELDWLALPMSIIATDDVIKKQSIGVGDELFITGLFVHHSGQAHNIPIIRVGNIAAMPDEKVSTKDLGSIDAYLIEARSIGGLSGSPVFVNLDSLRAGMIIMSAKQKGFGGRIYYLLGMMHGHIDANESEFDGVTQNIKSSRINTGIGIVVPATKLLEIINQPKFQEERQAVVNIEKGKAITS
jgi:hypothetical protein